MAESYFLIAVSGNIEIPALTLTGCRSASELRNQFCSPDGIRTRVTAVKGQRPEPTRRQEKMFVRDTGFEPVTFSV